MYPIKKHSVKSVTYWKCERCKIDNVEASNCPCPRGSCEAEPLGVIRTTTEIIFTPPKPKDAPIVPFGDIEEMRCPTCEAITGHHLIDKAWACIHCGTKRK